MTGLEQMKAYATGKLQQPAIAQLLGINFDEVSDGFARMNLQVSDRFYNPMGTLHGGILCDLGDAAMGCAAATKLSEGESYTTIELKTNFFKPVRSGKLSAHAKVTRMTKSIIYIECDISDVEGGIVSKQSSTCFILRGNEAKGR